MPYTPIPPFTPLSDTILATIDSVLSSFVAKVAYCGLVIIDSLFILINIGIFN